MSINVRAQATHPETLLHVANSAVGPERATGKFVLKTPDSGWLLLRHPVDPVGLSLNQKTRIERGLGHGDRPVRVVTCILVALVVWSLSVSGPITDE